MSLACSADSGSFGRELHFLHFEEIESEFLAHDFLIILTDLKIQNDSENVAILNQRGRHNVRPELFQRLIPHQATGLPSKRPVG